MKPTIRAIRDEFRVSKRTAKRVWHFSASTGNKRRKRHGQR